MKTILWSLIFFASSFSLAAAPPIVVKVKSGERLPDVQGVSGSRHLFDGIYLIFGDSPELIKEELARHAVIERFYVNSRAEAVQLPLAQQLKGDDNFPTVFNDPNSSRQWHLKDAGQNGVSVVRAYTEYGKSQGQTVTVAVVDTGVAYDHEDLKNVMWRNPGEIAGNGVDDDGNGYVDDIHGVNFLSRDSQGKPSSDPADTHSHGTHVSGIIGAEQDNSVGITGVASNVKIMALRTVPNSGDEIDSDVAEAFLYAAKNGAKIINCSFGKGHKEGDLVEETIRHIGEQYSVLVVAAAGNDSKDIDQSKTYPASYDSENILVVASTTSSGGRSYFSNYGRIGVDLGAPGSSIYSTVPRGYGSMSGTSMASPVAAGVAAEVLSRHPQLTPVQLKEVLMRTVTESDALQGRTVTGGRIDLFGALTALKGLWLTSL